MKRSARQQLSMIGHLLRTAGQHFLRDNCRGHAAALTFTTLFAVVPMMTVVFTALAAVPSLKPVSAEIQQFIFSNLVPSTGEAVQQHLGEFAQQASQLTIVGIGMLFVTAIMMLVTIERAFNEIWQVRAPKQGLISFLRYWAVLSLGPFLLGAGFVLSSYIMSLRVLRDTADIVGTVLPGIGVIPLLFTALGFTLLYTAVPNCRVPWRAGLISGFVAACLFELAKRGFGIFVTGFSSYQLVYGAFAAFPVFLLWIYLSWLIILFGVELSRSLVLHDVEARPSQHPLLALMTLLQRLQSRHAEGLGVTETEVMRILQRSTQWGWSQWQDWLLTQHFMVRTADGDFRLARDLGQVDVAELLPMLPWSLPVAAELGVDGPHDAAQPWLPALRAWLQPVQQACQRPQALHQLLNGEV
ncbi:MAG: YihY family inner membrane protein [Pseudomonadota bacterium]